MRSWFTFKSIYFIEPYVKWHGSWCHVIKTLPKKSEKKVAKGALSQCAKTPNPMIGKSLKIYCFFNEKFISLSTKITSQDCHENFVNSYKKVIDHYKSMKVFNMALDKSSGCSTDLEFSHISTSFFLRMIQTYFLVLYRKDALWNLFGKEGWA